MTCETYYVNIPPSQSVSLVDAMDAVRESTGQR